MTEISADKESPQTETKNGISFPSTENSLQRDGSYMQVKNALLRELTSGPIREASANLLERQRNLLEGMEQRAVFARVKRLNPHLPEERIPFIIKPLSMLNRLQHLTREEMLSVLGDYQVSLQNKQSLEYIKDDGMRESRLKDVALAKARLLEGVPIITPESRPTNILRALAGENNDSFLRIKRQIQTEISEKKLSDSTIIVWNTVMREATKMTKKRIDDLTVQDLLDILRTKTKGDTNEKKPGLISQWQELLTTLPKDDPRRKSLLDLIHGAESLYTKMIDTIQEDTLSRQEKALDKPGMYVQIKQTVEEEFNKLHFNQQTGHALNYQRVLLDTMQEQLIGTRPTANNQDSVNAKARDVTGKQLLHVIDQEIARYKRLQQEKGKVYTETNSVGDTYTINTENWIAAANEIKEKIFTIVK